MKFRSMTTVSALALFGALGAGSAAHAAVTVGFDPSCPGMSSTFGRSSVVLSNVTAGSPNTYEFKICNTSNTAEGEARFLLRDWELPYDPLGGIANYAVPFGWNVNIETIGSPNSATGWDGEDPTWFNPTDPFYDPRYLGLTQVVHFYTCGNNTCYGSDDPLEAGEGLTGFGFTSPFGETNAPYQASWIDQFPRSGDPAFPLAGGPNTPGLINGVSEPGGLALFALSLGTLMAARARRQGRKPD